MHKTKIFEERSTEFAIIKLGIEVKMPECTKLIIINTNSTYPFRLLFVRRWLNERKS